MGHAAGEHPLPHKSNHGGAQQAWQAEALSQQHPPSPRDTETPPKLHFHPVGFGRINILCLCSLA